MPERGTRTHAPAPRQPRVQRVDLHLRAGGGTRRRLARRSLRHRLCGNCRHQSGAVPHEISRLGHNALPPFQGAFLAKEPHMVFCAMVDRNGFLPVHNKIYPHPQRPGDVAWKTANSRNRRIFNDQAGLAAARNVRSYLFQSYARDMGNGNTVMMREIDVPIRVQGTGVVLGRLQALVGPTLLASLGGSNSGLRSEWNLIASRIFAHTCLRSFQGFCKWGRRGNNSQGTILRTRIKLRANTSPQPAIGIESHIGKPGMLTELAPLLS